jgi:hypothetical protein
MDDEKEKEGGGGGWGISTEVEIFIAIVAVIILVLFSGVLSHVTWLTGPITNFFTSGKDQAAFSSGLKTFVGSLVGLSIPVSVMLFIGIVISVERLKKIRRKEHEIYNAHVEEAYIAPASAGVAQTNQDNIVRWRKILTMVDSTNQNDWRQAIIESDIILDEILTKANYPGMDLGSKIRTATPADFKTVELAGEAHGIRNRIAHDGSNYPISQHEAKRVVNLYKQVFEEFYYI